MKNMKNNRTDLVVLLIINATATLSDIMLITGTDY